MRKAVLLAVFSFLLISLSNGKPKLLAITVATDITDGFLRLKDSLDFYEYDYEVLGIGDEWHGGDVKNTIGGGQKVNLLRNFLRNESMEDDTVLLCIDGYDVIVNHEPDIVLDKFLDNGHRILFGAEGFCWPDSSLRFQYPEVGEGEKRFLNSGGFIGYAKDIKQMLGEEPLADNEDDQLYYTKYFLDSNKDEIVGLDTKSEIFQNLNGAESELKMEFENNLVVLQNKITNSTPSIIHGNGPTKITLNRIGNYVGGAWSSSIGCLHCDKNSFDLLSINRNKWPRLLIYLTISKPTPFVNEFLKNVEQLTYPKHLLHLMFHNTEDRWNPLVKEFVKSRQEEYASVTLLEGVKSERDGFSQAKSHCEEIQCSSMLLLDATARLDDDESLIFLIGLNKSIISPMLLRENSPFANFWGAINPDGFYERSDDYMFFIDNKRVGLWNVPYISLCILFTRDALSKIEVNEISKREDFDMSLATYLRGKGMFMWVSNIHNYGHLINADEYNTTAVHPELYEIFTNPEEWKQRYLHPLFYQYITSKELPYEEWKARYLVDAELNASEFYVRQPCTDIYWFPLFSERFATEMINTCNTSHLWSLGKHADDRIPGGYENVPTDDIHMTQLGWQEHWLHILKTFIQPIQMRIFLGYYSDPPRAPLSFVVRYDKNVQDHLRPHHDASTYTLDIALNKHGVDYQAGGVRFLRYNCSLVDTPVGWTLMFPGRLTHIHEGMKIESGQRYIFVSFIDP